MSLRSRYTKYFREPDGTMSAEMYSGQVHFRADNGEMREIDTTLIPCDDPSQCAFTNRRGPLMVEFGSNVRGESEFLHIPDIDRTGTASLGFGATDALSGEATVGGNRITYPDVWPGADLAFEVHATDMSADIIVHDRPSGPVSYRFPLFLDRLEARQDPNGEIELVNDAGEVRFRIPLRAMIDSSVSPISAEPAYSDAVAMTLESVGGFQFIKVTPDLAWLQDPARVYPVVIDPPIIKDDNYDTFVEENVSTSRHQETTLKIGKKDNSNNKTRALLRFEDVNDLQGKVIEEARLHLWESYAPSCNATQVNVHRINQYWVETVNWAGQPTVDTAVAASKQTGAGGSASGCPAGWVDFNVTNTVKQWVSGTPNYGLELRAALEGDYGYFKKFNSAQTNVYDTGGRLTAPYLKIGYNSIPGPVTGMEPGTGTVSTNGTPELWAIYNDADVGYDDNGNYYSDWGHVDFEVQRSGCTPVEATACFFASGQGKVDNPDIELGGGPGKPQYWPTPLMTDGTVYKWRARGDDNKDSSPEGPWSGWFTYTYQSTPPPGAPTVTYASHPDDRYWYQDNTPTFTWSATGASAYSYSLTSIYDVDEPNTTADQPSPTVTYPAQPDGDYWFNVRAYGNNQWGPATHYKIQIDATAPAAPVIASSSHTTETGWFRSDDPCFSWTPPTELYSGVEKYAYKLDTNASTNPTPPTGQTRTTAPTASNPLCFSNVGDGIFYMHANADDKSLPPDHWGPPDHRTVKIDGTAPPPPVVVSNTHPDQDQWFPGPDIQLEWSVSELSPIKAYSYDFNQTKNFPLNKTAEQKRTSITYSEPDGVYYFHVRAKNATGLWGPQTTFTVRVGPSQGPVPSITSPSHPQGSNGEVYWYSDRTPDFNWTIADPQQVTGYSYDIDPNPAHAPDTASEGQATSASYEAAQPDGIKWFHVRARTDAHGWGGQPGHFEFRVDSTAPTGPIALASMSHVPGVAFSDPTIDMAWGPGSDPGALGSPPTGSGIKEYWWAFRAEGPDGNRGAPPSQQDHQTSAAGEQTATSAPLDDGRYWFHVVSVDRASNLSDDKVYGPIIVDQDGSAIPLNPSLEDALVAHSDEAGLEQFYPYESMDLGTSTAYVNLGSGNLVVQQQHEVVPAQGLNAVIRHTYNSIRSDASYHDTGVGRGWSLSLSDLEGGLDYADGAITDIDLNAPIVPTTADAVDVVAGATGRLLELTDGDGTTHRFIRRGGPGTRWDSPPGVALRVHERLDSTTGLPEAYELIRPDGVTYEATQPVVGGLRVPTWHVTAIEDRNGNRLELSYAKFGSLGGRTPVSDIRVTAVTHNARPAEPLVRFDYGDASGDLERIVTLPGVSAVDPATGQTRSYERRIDFDIDSNGLLQSVTHAAHELPAGAVDARRTTTFDYVDDSGAACDGVGQLLTDVSDCKLSAVSDGRDDTTASTVFSYDRAQDGLRLRTVTDRRGKAWTYDYGAADPNTGERTTTATTPVASSDTIYRVSGRTPVSSEDERIAGGNILEIKDPGNNTGRVRTTYGWKENRLVEHADGFGNTTHMHYNDLGLVTKLVTPAPNLARSDPALPQSAPTAPVTTTFSYEGQDEYRYAMDKCSEPPPSGPDPKISSEMYCDAVAELVRTVGAADISSQARVTDFSYDDDGNLARVVGRAEPGFSGSTAAPAATDDRESTFTYYERGGLRALDGPRAVNDTTVFGNDDGADPYGGYDRTGMPLTITDGLSKTKSFAFSPYGLVSQETDRAGRVTKARYDELDRAVEEIDPAGHATAYSYDDNGNLLTQTTPRDLQTRHVYNDADWRTQTSTPGATESDVRTVTLTSYNHDGTINSQTNAVGGVTVYEYYDNRQRRSISAPAGSTGGKAVTSFTYDAAGRLVQTTHPKANAAGSRPIETLDYAPNGNVVKSIATSPAEDAQGAPKDAVTRFAYNAHDNRVQILGPREKGGVTEEQDIVYDSFGQARSVSRRESQANWLANTYDFDPAGNAIRSTQPTGDGEGDDGTLVSTYRYDELNRLAEQTKDSFNPGQNGGHTVSFEYLPEGQQRLRVDYHDGNEKRRTETSYNSDYTVASVVTTQDGKTLAACNFEANQAPESGYDEDQNLLITRTITGQNGCQGGDTIKTETFAYDDRDWLREITQRIDLPGDGHGAVSRTQVLTHKDDGMIATSTWDGKTTTYGYSDAGWLESATDWRDAAGATNFSYLPSRSYEHIDLGGGVATGALTYRADGSPASLVWSRPGGMDLRKHTDMTYDVGGLRVGEDVTVAAPQDSPAGFDTFGRANFDYDLAGRLMSWTSPYNLTDEEPDSSTPTTTYALDDGGNVTREEVKVEGQTRRLVTAAYPHGRLSHRTVTTTDLIVPGETTTTEMDFTYSGLGEEKVRDATTTVAGVEVADRVDSDYDPAGHTSKATYTKTIDGSDEPAPDVSYLYDASDRVIVRTKHSTTNDTTTLHFYFGDSSVLAEEAKPSGDTEVRYFIADGRALAQQSYRGDATGTWTWLLYDPDLNVGTHLKDNGTVTAQRAYDPYGAAEAGGTDASSDDPGSTLGYQGAHTDETTGNLLLGPRVYDPTTERFTTADFYAGAGSDLALGTDPLTGNRYLFAGANPVGFYDDGHLPLRETGGAGGGGIGALVTKLLTQIGLAGQVVGQRVGPVASAASTRALEAASRAALWGKDFVSRGFAAAQRIPGVQQVLGGGAPQRTFDIAPRVIEQLKDPRLGHLAGKLTPADLQRLIHNPSAQRLLDIRGEYNTINIVQEIQGVLLRITTRADAFQIISVGRTRAQQVINGIAKGKFVELR